MPSPFPGSPVICECLWKKNPHRKKKKKIHGSDLQESIQHQQQKRRPATIERGYS